MCISLRTKMPQEFSLQFEEKTFCVSGTKISGPIDFPFPPFFQPNNHFPPYFLPKQTNPRGK
jgi:hypothetical protein